MRHTGERAERMAERVRHSRPGAVGREPGETRGDLQGGSRSPIARTVDRGLQVAGDQADGVERVGLAERVAAPGARGLVAGPGEPARALATSPACSTPRSPIRRTRAREPASVATSSPSPSICPGPKAIRVDCSMVNGPSITKTDPPAGNAP
jgi:hypothetical protein